MSTQSSVNFAFLAVHDPSFDRIGRSAEALLSADPDLALTCLRKLAELIVTGVAHHERVSFCTIELNERIKTLRSRCLIGFVEEEALAIVRRAGNEGTHAKFGELYRLGPLRKEAKKAMKCMRRVGVWFHLNYGNDPDFEDSGFSFEFLSGSGADGEVGDVSDRYVDLHALLDRAEIALERHRREPEALEELERARNKLRADRSKLEPWQAEFCQLRIDSIELARRNHHGEQPQIQGAPAALEERDRELLRTGRPEVLDEVTLFHNRWAVGQLNAFLFEEALRQIERFVAGRSAALKAGYGVFGTDTVQDYSLGALLGTQGQTQAFLAHQERDPGWLDMAIETFEEARQRFSDPADRARQDAYKAHAILDRLRFNPDQDLSPREERFLDRLEAQALEAMAELVQDPIPSQDWQRVFQVGLALKIGLVRARPQGVSWEFAQALNGALEKSLEDESWSPPHPYEQICGALALLYPQCPGRIRAALTRSSQQDSLVGMIAFVYGLEVEHRRDSLTPKRVEGFLRRCQEQPGWPAGLRSSSALDARVRELCSEEGGGPLAILPFHYA
ncbi:MAG: DUF4145 domain-containing protein [Planctomycetes bacterium]|nr:DUF4145 domain-containing protein [Planctomycetota bacterium]